MFYDIVFGSGILGLFIWGGLFCVSTTALSFVLILSLILRKKNFLNKKICQKTEAGSLLKSLNQIESNGSLFDRIYMVLHSNSYKNNAELEDLAAEIIGRDSRRILRKIAALQTCANVAPMLGLLGTVQGMVAAFMALGTSVGPEKASVLAVSISQALYTTAAGLVVAIPSTILCIAFRNRLEAIVDDLNEDIKKLIDVFPGGR